MISWSEKCQLKSETKKLAKLIGNIAHYSKCFIAYRSLHVVLIANLAFKITFGYNTSNCYELWKMTCVMLMWRSGPFFMTGDFILDLISVLEHIRISNMPSHLVKYMHTRWQNVVELTITPICAYWTSHSKAMDNKTDLISICCYHNLYPLFLFVLAHNIRLSYFLK